MGCVFHKFSQTQTITISEFSLKKSISHSKTSLICEPFCVFGILLYVHMKYGIFIKNISEMKGYYNYFDIPYYLL